MAFTKKDSAAVTNPEVQPQTEEVAAPKAQATRSNAKATELMFTGEVEVKPAGMSASKFFSDKSYDKVVVDPEEFKRDCKAAGLGTVKTLKDSRWAS